MAAAKGRSLEETPTWAVAIVCFVLVAISILIEHALHLMGKWLTKRNKRALYEALEKIKSELMLLGFLSLLLTVGQGPISEICVSKALADTWHPCSRKSEEEKYKDTYGGTGNDVHKGRRRLLASAASASLDSNQSHRRVLAAAGYDKCASQGKVPFVSAYAIHELHIFIFVLAVFHVLYCITTLALGRAKMRKWKSWERETKTTEYQFSHDPERFRFARDTSFGRRHLSFWSSSPILLWIVCFFRQFVRSVRKVDYFTLRHGFIVAHLAPQSQHNFDFQKYISRSLDEDFKVVVGISPPIWFFAVVFLLFNTHGWHSYLWLPFVPLVIILLVGSKLQVIITKMGLSIEQRGEVVKGTPLVQPGDDLFWFNWPRLILYLINFVLFQNAFQLAFFAFAWYKFGLRSCFHEKTEDIIIRVSMGLLIQILCSYVTLPLYALVTQMGSTMKPTVFNDKVAKALHSWHQTAKKHIKQQRQSGSISPLTSTPPHGSSPTHLLRYYRNETDSVDTFSRVSNFDRQLLETEGSVSPSRNLEEMPCSQANPNHDIEKEEKNDNEMNSEGSVPRTHLFQHGINIHSSDFSFDKS